MGSSPIDVILSGRNAPSAHNEIRPLSDDDIPSLCIHKPVRQRERIKTCSPVVVDKDDGQSKSTADICRLKKLLNHDADCGCGRDARVAILHPIKLAGANSGATRKVARRKFFI